MKNITFLTLLLAVLLLIGGCGKKEGAGTNEKDKSTTENTSGDKKNLELGENSSINIVYSLSESPDMTLELFTKGKKARSEVKGSSKGVPMNAVAYFPGDGFVYSVVELAGQKIGMKMKANELDSEKDFSSFILKAREQFKDYEKGGTGEVLGYECNIFKDKDGNKYYMYKDFLLMKFEGVKGSITATKVNTDAKFEDSIFEVPKDVDFDKLNLDMDKLKNLSKPKK